MRERFIDLLTVKEEQSILNIIRYMISKRVEISLNIKGEKSDLQPGQLR
jgi:hypothetical protein